MRDAKLGQEELDEIVDQEIERRSNEYLKKYFAVFIFLAVPISFLMLWSYTSLYEMFTLKGFLCTTGLAAFLAVPGASENG